MVGGGTLREVLPDSAKRPLLILESLPAAEWLGEHLSDYRVTGRVNGNSVLEAG